MVHDCINYYSAFDSLAFFTLHEQARFQTLLSKAGQVMRNSDFPNLIID